MSSQDIESYILTDATDDLDNSGTDVIFLNGTETVERQAGVCRSNRTPGKFAPSPQARYCLYYFGKPLCVVFCLLFVMLISILVILAIQLQKCHSSGKKDPVQTAEDFMQPLVSPPTEESSYNHTTCDDHFPWTELRLPASLLPTHYDLEVRTDLYAFRFTGIVKITLQANETVRKIVLHSKHLILDSRELCTASGTLMSISSFKQCEKLEQWAFETQEPLVAGSVYILTLAFRGNITDSMQGFYRSTYKDSHGQRNYLAMTQFEPTYARQAFPSFDEPLFKATFSVSIVHHKNEKSLSNMPRTTTEQFPGHSDFVIDRFDRSLRMSTYLVAYVVMEDFGGNSNVTKDNVTVSVYAPHAQLDQTGLALSFGVRSLQFLGEFFQIPYPLKKQDLMAVVDFAAGAMENWGLITFRDQMLLYKEGYTSSIVAETIATVVAHELAHQWFGNLVTMKWWNDLWLNEGFASFVEFYTIDQLEPSWGMMQKFFADSTTKAMLIDGLTHSHPVSVVVNDPKEIDSIFDAISYEKGASLIYMLMGVMGSAKLQAGLQHYLSKFKYDNAVSDDLWHALQEQISNLPSGVSLADIMHGWTMQQGYPYVHARLEGNSVVLDQSRFLYSQSAQRDSSGDWYIPVTWISSDHSYGGSSSSVWIPPGNSAATVDIGSAAKWYKLNVNQTGFYRVLYSEANWLALATQLNTNHTVFSPVDRAGILNDAFAFVRAGYLNLSIYVKLIDYYSREDSYAPFLLIADHLGFIENLLNKPDDDKEMYAAFKNYMRKVLQPIYSRLATWNMQNETHQQRVMQASVLARACHYEVDDCVVRAQGLFNQWKENTSVTESTVHPDLRYLLCAVGVRQGNLSDWQWVYQRYNESTIPTEQAYFLKALAVSTNQSLLLRLLDMAMDANQIRPNDITRVFDAVGSNPLGTDIAWGYLLKKWTVLKEKLGGTTLLGLILRTLIAQKKTQTAYDEVKIFFAGEQLGANQRTFDQAVELLQLNIQWLHLHRPALVAWLKTYGIESTV